MTAFDQARVSADAHVHSDELARRIHEHADRLRDLARHLATERRLAADEAHHSRLVHWQGALEIVMGACPEADTVAFVREGEYWTIGRQRQFRLRDTKGLGYLARLVSEPGREVHALDLVAEVPGICVQESGDLAPLDRIARDAYAARLAELEVALAEADADADSERASAAREEIDWIRREIAAAYGLGSRARPGPTAAERARQSVTKAIRVAIGRIEAEDPELARHLERCVHTGTYCSYDPDPGAEIRWHT